MPDANEYLSKLINGKDYVRCPSREQAEKVKATAFRPDQFSVEQDDDGVWIVRYTGRE